MHSRETIVITLLVAFAMFANIGSSLDQGEVPASRADPGAVYGGGIVEEFENQSMIESLDSAIWKEGYVEPYIEPFDNFNNYTDDYTIIGKNGWERHTQYNYGYFDAEASSTFGSSSMIAKQYNGNSGPGEHSIVLSKDFSLTKGIIRIKAATSMVDQSDHTTTQIVLFGNAQLYPDPVNDRLLMIGFNKGGISCFNGVWNDVLDQASLNTWYTISIEFDCTEKLATITVSSGMNFGKVTCAFENDFGKLRRIGLTTGRALESNTITSYWDDLCVFDTYPISRLVSGNITLPPNAQWRSLRYGSHVSPEHRDIYVTLTVDRSEEPQ